jgi:hypothetical protein
VVRQHVFESLNFRAAGRRAEELLRNSSEDLADAVAAKGYFDEVTAPDLLAKLSKARREHQEAGASADVKLARLLDSIASPGRSQRIATLLADPTFNFDSAASKNHLSYVAREFPDVLSAAMVSRIEAGKELPRHAKDYLSETQTRNVGPVREYMATPGTSEAKGAALIAGQELTHDLCLRYLASYAAAATGGDRSQGAWQPTRDLEAVLALTPTSSFFAAIARFDCSTSLEDISGLCRLIARYCRDVDQGRATLSELHADVVRTLQNWAAALLLSSNDRSQLADLAGAMQRVPDPTHVDALDRMLRRDQDLHAQARQAYKANPEDNRALQDMRVWYNWTYRDALVAVGTDPATSVLTVHLSDEYFGLDAAVGLMLIWRKRHGREGQIRPGSWPVADTIVANRESRKIDPGATTPEAEAIFAHVETLLGGGEPEHVRRAAAMASAATLLPHGDKTGILGQLLAARPPASNTYGLLSHMAMGGIIVKAVDVMAGLESALAGIKNHSWLNEQDAEALVRWLELFLCSDRPMTLFAAIDKMPEALTTTGWRMRSILRFLAVTTEREAPDILRALIVRFPELTDQHELRLALLKQPLEIQLEIMLDIADGKIGSRRGLEGVAYRFPELDHQRWTSADIGSVVQRFQEEAEGPGKMLLSQILLATNDPEIFLMLGKDASGRAAADGQLPWLLGLSGISCAGGAVEHV